MKSCPSSLKINNTKIPFLTYLTGKNQKFMATYSVAKAVGKQKLIHCWCALA